MVKCHNGKLNMLNYACLRLPHHHVSAIQAQRAATPLAGVRKPPVTKKEEVLKARRADTSPETTRPRLHAVGERRTNMDDRKSRRSGTTPLNPSLALRFPEHCQLKTEHFCLPRPCFSQKGATPSHRPPRSQRPRRWPRARPVARRRTRGDDPQRGHRARAHLFRQ